MSEERGLLRRVADGLASVMTGAGTSVDKRTHQHWQTRMLDELSIITAFRASWLMRKVVSLPPQDMTRAGRDWQAEKEEIEAIEREERRLRVNEKMRLGLILGRLGGGAIIMGVAQGTASAPLNLERVGKGALRYLHVVSRHALSLGDKVTDPDSDYFGEPEFFKLRGKDGRDAEIHRSRVIVFKGEFNGALEGSHTATGTSKEDAYWGDSVVQIVNDAVMNAVTAQDEIAGLISEAKIDVFGIPDLLSMMGDPDAEKRVMRRLELANVGKSNHRAMVRDAGETWEQRQITWAGMPDVIRTFLSIVAGAADIPATRLLGKSPDGMNATGDSDERNYHEMIESKQTSELAPALDILDEVLIRSALGNRPPEITYEFAPLRVLSEKEQAEVENKEADSVSKLVNVGLIPDEALAQAVANRMIESGRWPGLDKALEGVGEKWWETVASEPEESEGGLPEGTGTGGPGGNQPAPSGPPSRTE